MSINDRIVDRIGTIDSLMTESICAADNGNWYCAGKYAAAARDACAALADRVDCLARSLEESGYSDNTGYRRMALSLQNLTVSLAVKVRGFEALIAQG